MKTFFGRKVLGYVALAIVSCTALSAACSGEELRRPPGDLPPDEQAVRFTPFEAPAFGRPRGELRRVVTSAGEYEALLGSPPPADLDFRREWVVLYAAGTFSTGGYMAEIAHIGRSPGGRSLQIETRLSTPGPRCFVTQAFTSPYVVARFPRPAGEPRVTFTHETEVVDCGGAL